MDPLLRNPAPLLGKSSNGELFRDLFRSYGLPRAPYVEQDEPQPIRFWLPIKQVGLEFGFTDEGYYLARPEAERHDGNLICTTIYYYNWPNSEIRRFAGELPHGLAFENGRAEVQATMKRSGPPAASYERDVYRLEDHKLIVSYAADERSISDLILRRPNMPYPRPRATVPTPSDVIKLFGLSPREERFQRAFEAFDIEGKLDELQHERKISFIHQAGFELVFTWGRLLVLQRQAAGLAFSGIRLFRSREQDAVEWPGALPFDLNFGSSPAGVLASIGVSPDEGTEDDQMGFFLWHMDDFSLHVWFDKVENEIRCLSLYAPGYWMNRAEASKIEGRGPSRG